MIPFFDVHTHGVRNKETVLVQRIENIHQETEKIENPQFVSVGLHPRLITDNWEKDWAEIWETAQKYHIVAIGETGLDRLCPKEWTLQKKVFQQQIQEANRLCLPLLIHCVRAYPEALQALEKANVPVIFHGFSGKYSRIQPAVSAGYSVSFGKAILHPKSPARQALAQIPIQQVLLETDGADLSIESIYKMAAELKEIEIEDLKDLMMQNAQRLFPL